jgi:hypothetical protein
VQQQLKEEKKEVGNSTEASEAGRSKEKKSFFMVILIYISHCWDRNWHLSVG